MTLDADAPDYAHRRDAELVDIILASNSAVFPTYTVATVPQANPPARQIYVSDETGGSVLAFSDGTNWRRVTDRAIVS